MRFQSLRCLRQRRSIKDISNTRAKWELRFYLWRSVVGLTLATALVIDTIVALIEGRPPPLADWVRYVLIR